MTATRAQQPHSPAKPVTPLPWKYVQHNGTEPEKFQGRPAFQPAYVYGKGKKPIFGFQNMPNDAAYIVQACNAYPKLIAALRSIAKPALGGKQQQYAAQQVLKELGL